MFKMKKTLEKNGIPKIPPKKETRKKQNIKKNKLMTNYQY